MQWEADIQKQHDFYLAYAHAAQVYGKIPTFENWEKKEKAFEIYNALLHQKLVEKTKTINYLS